MGFGRAKGRPRVLYVAMPTGGGVPLTTVDLMRAVGDECEAFLLGCDGLRLTLSRFDENGDMTVVESAVLDRPVSLPAHHSPDYGPLARTWLRGYGISLIHIRHLAWHSLDLPLLAEELGLPLVFSFHDFYTVCPNTQLFTPEGLHCGGGCGGRDRFCRPLKWPRQGEGRPSDNITLTRAFVRRWREIFSGLLKRASAYVVTSEAAGGLIAETLNLPPEKFFNIPHGRDFAAMTAPRPWSGESPHRLLVPGNISEAKGGLLLAELGDLNRAGRFEFHFLGEIFYEPAARAGIRHGPYRREDFQSLAGAVEPYAGLILSGCPETWCHTLTELWASGLPAGAFDLGAVGERGRRRGGLWLWPASLGAGELMERLEEMAADRIGYEKRAAEIRAWQTGPGAANTTRAMAGAYLSLYRRCGGFSR